LLISLGAIAECAIEELVEQTQQFHLSENLKWTAQESFSLQKVPDVFFGENNSPANVRERDILRSAQRTNFAIADLDV
jgi:hypothetical protein